MMPRDLDAVLFALCDPMKTVWMELPRSIVPPEERGLDAQASCPDEDRRRNVVYRAWEQAQKLEARAETAEADWAWFGEHWRDGAVIVVMNAKMFSIHRARLHRRVGQSIGHGATLQEAVCAARTALKDGEVQDE